MDNVDKGPLFPGVIWQKENTLSPGVVWHLAHWPGENVRAFATYDAAARWLRQRKQGQT